MLKKKDWKLIIIGNLITPHGEFRKFEKKYQNVTYLSPKDQESKYPELSKAIEWRKIQRRNIIGYVEACINNAEIVATVDDDNITYKDLGEKFYVWSSEGDI